MRGWLQTRRVDRQSENEAEEGYIIAGKGGEVEGDWSVVRYYCERVFLWYLFYEGSDKILLCDRRVVKMAKAEE